MSAEPSPPPQAIVTVPIPPSPKKGWPSWRNWAIGGGGLLVLVIVVGALMGGHPSVSRSISPTPATGSPTWDADQQHRLAIAYAAAAGNTGPMIEALDSIGADCGSLDLGSYYLVPCRADLMSGIEATDVYTTALDKLTVPPCLVQADRDLRAGLALREQGEQQAVNGIDANDASQVIAGTALINQGTGAVDSAAAEVTGANCP